MPVCVPLVAFAELLAPAPARARKPHPSREWEILDNSFLVEEAFNQERGVFQNIFTWALDRDGSWAAAFIQERPAPGMTHQLSYTLAVADTGEATGFGDRVLNVPVSAAQRNGRRPCDLAAIQRDSADRPRRSRPR
jgi:hypothetical protein